MYKKKVSKPLPFLKNFESINILKVQSSQLSEKIRGLIAFFEEDLESF